MAVDATGSATSTTNKNAVSNNPWANASASAGAANKASLNYDSFLKLLIAQMKNQDPTSPMDASQQMSQLASFSQVEQTIQTNTHLKSMLQAEAITRAGDLVGKYVMSADDKTSGKIAQVEVYTDGVIALTDKGEKILMQAGVVVSDTAIAPPATPAASSAGSETSDKPADSTS